MTSALDHDVTELVAADDAIIGRVFWISIAFFIVAALGAAAFFFLRSGEAPLPPPTPPKVNAPTLKSARTSPPLISFANVSAAWGITHNRESGARGDKLMPETLGGSVAIVDIDGDGDQDLVFTGGMPWPKDVATAEVRPSIWLYLNEAPGRFREAAAELGLTARFQGMGIAAADADGDGDVDLFFTALGPDLLYLQEDGRFREAAADCGVAGDPTAWSTCATFFDADRDGDLDLFVGHYVKWSREIDFEVDFRLTGVGRAYGPPMSFEGTNSSFFRNQGGGKFADESAAAGIEVQNKATGHPAGKALGVIVVDFDRDGYQDLIVANDTVQNFLFRNKQDGTFEEMGALAGVAFDRDGRATGAMGIDSARYRNTDDLGIVIANFGGEMSSLYVSQRDPSLFSDEAISEGIGAPTRLRLGFGIVFCDADLDGRLDLIAANGHIEEEIGTVQPAQTYLQAAQLFWNAGEGGAAFIEAPESTTGALATPIVGRGLAVGDLDGDGDLDAIIAQPAGAPLVLENQQNTGNHWLRVALRGRPGNAEAIGAEVRLTCGGVVQRQCVVGTRSYLSQSEFVLTFGLGKASAVERLEVIWPDGVSEQIEVTGVDQVLQVERGE